MPWVCPAASGQRDLHHSSVPYQGTKPNSMGVSQAPSCQARSSIAVCGLWKITGCSNTEQGSLFSLFPATGIWDKPPHLQMGDQ